jgi:hypothetical protein
MDVSIEAFTRFETHVHLTVMYVPKSLGSAELHLVSEEVDAGSLQTGIVPWRARFQGS